VPLVVRTLSAIMIFSPTSKPSRTESTCGSRVRKWKPIVFLKRHYSHQEISRYYRAADLCLVTSLHDATNKQCCC
jgi:hypothetical protein